MLPMVCPACVVGDGRLEDVMSIPCKALGMTISYAVRISFIFSQLGLCEGRNLPEQHHAEGQHTVCKETEQGPGQAGEGEE